MKYEVIIRPEAEDDLRDAFLWYEDKRTGLGYVRKRTYLHQMKQVRNIIIKYKLGGDIYTI